MACAYPFLLVGHEFTHSCIRREKSKEESGLLNKFSPRGKGRQGHDTPLHHIMGLAALIRNQSWTSVLARLKENPQEAGEDLPAITRGGFVATCGFTPLHYACERRPPLEVVDALIAAWPEAITTRLQPGGALPLHVACTWHASESTVRAITQAEPAACRIPDDLGNIPLHCAVFSGAEVQVVDMLLRIYPTSVLARNHQGSLAIDIIKRLRHDNRRAVMELVVSTKDGVVPAHHQRTRSNGSCGAIAQRALELNSR